MHKPLIFLIVWLAISAIARADAVPQVGVDQAIRNGSRWLLEDLEPRMDRAAGLPVGRTALAYYALVKSGVPRDRPAMQQAAAFLAEAYTERTYDLGCLILALAADDPIAHAPRIHQLAHSLADHQNRVGDWGYPGGADLSNTQYAALGLWKASQVGVRIHPSVWKRLAQRTMVYQVEGGSFGYSAQSAHGTASMTAAGAGVLAICEQQLRISGELDYALAEQIIPARRQAQAWLGAELGERVGATSWHYYYLYGLERLGALSGCNSFGDRNWYELGAAKLIEDQDPEGSWAKDDIKTSFALLFLARATSSMGRAVAFTGEDATKSADPNAICQLQSSGDSPLELGVGWWNRPVLRRFEWPEERGLGPRISWVEYLADGEIIHVQLADGSRPLGNQYFRFHHHFLRKGAKQIFARFHLEVPPPPRSMRGRAAEPVEVLPAVLESPPLQVLVQHSLPPEMQILPTLYGPRISLSGCKNWASSQAGRRDGLPRGEYSADAASDGSLASAWIFRAKDERRLLKLKPSIKVPASAVQVHPLVSDWAAAAGLQPISMLELRINGEHRFPLLMPKPGGAGVLDLPKPITIRTLEIRVLTLGDLPDPSSAASGMAGIAEIELYFGANQ